MRLTKIFGALCVLSFIAPSAVAQAPRQVRVISTSANVRQGPGTNQAILGSLSSGTVLEVMRDASPWYQVRLSPELGIGAPTGYIHSSTVELVLVVTNPQPASPPLVKTVQPTVVRQSTQAPPQQIGRPSYKDGGTAMVIGIIVPGGGQMYTGETKKGLTLLGAGLGGLILGVALSANSVGASCDENFNCHDDTNYAPAALGYLTYLGTWIYGIIDAGSSADRMNAKNGYVRSAVLAAPMVGTRGGRVAFGVRLTY